MAKRAWSSDGLSASGMRLWMSATWMGMVICGFGLCVEAVCGFELIMDDMRVEFARGEYGTNGNGYEH